MTAAWLRDAADALEGSTPTTRPDLLNVHVYAEDRPLGAYVIQVTVRPRSPHLDEAPLVCEIDLASAESLRDRLDGAIRSLRLRQIADAVAGPCAACRNTRMIHPLRNGRPTVEHCPTCRPLLDAAQQAFHEGRPPEVTR